MALPCHGDTEAWASGATDPHWLENPGPQFSSPPLKLEHKRVHFQS